MKCLIASILTSIFCVVGSVASNPTGRSVISFNSDWMFKQGMEQSSTIAYPKVVSSDWESVAIPHTWNNEDMQVKKNIFYAGTAFYKKVFTPDASLEGKRVFLRFQGVASVASVYVNEQFADTHKGGYAAFAIEITRLLKFGELNEILVRVDNASRNDVLPINHTLFGVYGGIYREVQMIVTEPINIAVTDYASPGIYLSQKNVNAKSADLNIKIKVENKHKDSRQIKIVSTIYEADGKVKASQKSDVTVTPQGRHFFEQNIKIEKPHLWQGLEDPYLYRVVTQLLADDGKVIDQVTQPLGLRHFELKAAEGMYLNGKKVPMYGVCRHQDWWGLGSALTKEHHMKDIEIIKEMGATTIRFAHYQQAEDIYAICDSIGFMVWAEIPFVNRISAEERDNARMQMTELIRQNYNHPSIYTWGLHNEVYRPHEYTAALTTELNDLSKSEDPYRYTVSVNGYGKIDHDVNLNADIQGSNRYFGWYEKTIGEIEDWVVGMENNFPNYLIMLAEYGAEANIDQQEENVGEVGRYFSQFYPETFSTKFHEIQWGVIEKHPYLVASYLWNTFDFATPVTTQGGVEARNMKGLVTFDRKIKKDPFYWYKANWSKEPVLYLTQRRAVERENQTTPVTVYSNIGTPELWVNGVKINTVKQGATAVHYIFENVKLSNGENTIETKVTKNGKSFEDKIVWQYTPKESKKQSDNVELKVNRNEHVGV